MSTAKEPLLAIFDFDQTITEVDSDKVKQLPYYRASQILHRCIDDFPTEAIILTMIRTNYLTIVHARESRTRNI